MAEIVYWPISWRIANGGESGEVANYRGTVVADAGAGGGGIGHTWNTNYYRNENYSATGDGFAVKDVPSPLGVNLTADNGGRGKMIAYGQGKHAYSFWFTRYTLNYTNMAGGGETRNSNFQLCIGYGATRREIRMTTNSYRWLAPQDLIKFDAGAFNQIVAGGGTTQWLPLAWPKEKWMLTDTLSYSGKYAGGQPNTYAESHSNSGTQIAQGYYSGPPLYSTTESRAGYTIKSSKLSWTSTSLNTVIIAPQISDCKTKPENFAWVAGGLHGAEPIAYGVAEVFVLDDFYKGFRDRVGFGNIGKSSWETVDNLSIISSSFGMSNVPVARVTKVYGNASNVETPTIKKTFTYVWPIGTAREATLAGFVGMGQGEDEDEAYRIISTSTFQSGFQKWVTNDTNGTYTYLAQDAKVSGLVGSTNTYSSSFQTRGDLYPFGEFYLGGTTSNKTEGYGYKETYKTDDKTQRTISWKQGIWTESTPVGFLSREYETDKVGYYYTDPDDRYFNAKGINTDFFVDTYDCYDATCIDFKRFANAQAFQTAKTIANNQVDATMKAPRNATTSITTQNKLSSQNNFKQTHTQQINIHPITGYISNTVSPYGDSADYTSVGIKELTPILRHESLKVCQTYGPNLVKPYMTKPYMPKGNAL